MIKIRRKNVRKSLSTVQDQVTHKGKINATNVTKPIDKPSRPYTKGTGLYALNQIFGAETFHIK